MQVVGHFSIGYSVKVLDESDFNGCIILEQQ